MRAGESTAFAPDRNGRVGPGRQRGMSMTAIMAIMGVTVFLGLFAVKAGPAYFENMTVKSIAETVASDEALMRGSRSKVYKQLNTQYSFNNLWDMKAEDTIDLKKDGRDGYKVRINYEKRETLFGNIDLVMRFDQEMTGEP